MTNFYKLGIAALVASLAFPAAASADGDPIELWGGFTTATTKAEVKFREGLPKKRLEVIPGCVAPFGYRTRKGTLVSVTFMAQDRDNDCHRRLLKIYRQELGEPEIKGVTFGSVIGYGGGAALDTTSEGAMLIWREGEKKTKLVKTPGNGFNLIFTVREDKYLH